MNRVGRLTALDDGRLIADDMTCFAAVCGGEVNKREGAAECARRWNGYEAGAPVSSWPANGCEVSEETIVEAVAFLDKHSVAASSVEGKELLARAIGIDIHTVIKSKKILPETWAVLDGAGKWIAEFSKQTEAMAFANIYNNGITISVTENGGVRLEGTR